MVSQRRPASASNVDAEVTLQPLRRTDSRGVAGPTLSFRGFGNGGLWPGGRLALSGTYTLEYLITCPDGAERL
ncbi:MAG TPA: hypothetical protein VM243_13180 [Phycisphaerae bacterium]|nr:hypothetical protein [Phycisphaerae bacterium]